MTVTNCNGYEREISALFDGESDPARALELLQHVAACPSCYHTWKHDYPQHMGEPLGFEVLHETEFLVDLIQDRVFDLKPVNRVVTYHDPCDLGRGSQEYDAPRRIINSIPGVELVELAHNRENCLCCGGGGNLEMIDSKLSGEIAKAKIDEVAATGAQAVITACQQCVRTMNTYVRRNKLSLEVLDIVQLVQKALGNN